MEQEFAKDYEQHLRAVYLTLTLLCVASVIIAAAPGKPEVSAARQQLDDIWGIVGHWDSAFLQTDNPSTEIDEIPDGLGPTEFSFEGHRLRTVFQTKQKISFTTLDHPPAGSHWKTDCNVDTRSQAGGRGNLDPRRVSDIIPQPKSLNDFQKVWDSLLDGATLHEPDWEGGIYAIRSGAAKRTIKAVDAMPLSAKEVKDVIPFRLQLQCLVPSTVAAINSTGTTITAHYQLHGRNGNIELYFPVYLQDSAVDGQSLLFHGRGDKWHHGYFKDSFRELGLAAKGFEDRKFNELVARLADIEVRSPAESLEVFGVKIPASLSLYGALAMILCTQLYLWVQLYEKSSDLRTTPSNVAWVGAYVSRPARALVVITMVCAPVASVASVCTRAMLAHGQHWYLWLALAGGLILSLGCGVASCRLASPTRVRGIASSSPMRSEPLEPTAEAPPMQR